MQINSKKSAAWNEGYKAYADAFLFTKKNPYAAGTQEDLDWKAGHSEAFFDHSW